MRREPIGLGEDDVKRDDKSAQLGEAGDQICNARTGPRPLTELSEALFVNVDDNDRPLCGDAGLYELKDVECPQAKLLEGSRIGDAQEEQREQQRHA
jgi:hypothetical protein